MTAAPPALQPERSTCPSLLIFVASFFLSLHTCCALARPKGNTVSITERKMTLPRKYHPEVAFDAVVFAENESDEQYLNKK